MVTAQLNAGAGRKKWNEYLNFLILANFSIFGRAFRVSRSFFARRPGKEITCYNYYSTYVRTATAVDICESHTYLRGTRGCDRKTEFEILRHGLVVRVLHAQNMQYIQVRIITKRILQRALSRPEMPQESHFVLVLHAIRVAPVFFSIFFFSTKFDLTLRGFIRCLNSFRAYPRVYGFWTRFNFPLRPTSRRRFRYRYMYRNVPATNCAEENGAWPRLQRRPRQLVFLRPTR